MAGKAARDEGDTTDGALKTLIRAAVAPNKA